MSAEKPTGTIILGQYGGFVTRLIAFVVDALIVSIAIGAITVIARFLTDIFHTGQYGDLFVTLVTIVTSIGLYIGYYVGFWVFAGQTLGKALMGLRVISADGGRVHIRQALIRLAGYWISAILFFFGYWVALVDDQRRALHDRLAKTLVVYSRNVGESFGAQPGTLRDNIQQARHNRLAQRLQQPQKE